MSRFVVIPDGRHAEVLGDRPSPRPYTRAMAHTSTPARTASYVVVIDGHTARESTWTLGRTFASREAAQTACDQVNSEVIALGTSTHRWHVEAR